MYRYSEDNTIVYTPEDIALFRESPFAAWMERLTLESPEHGIPHDIGARAPSSTVQAQDDIVATLQARGNEVTLIGWDLDEAVRREQTTAAMRRGDACIVNAQLASGPMAAAVNLLLRSAGASDLGSYVYLPCDTQERTTLSSAFRLCFSADLVHGIQGCLPAQMLIMRGGSDVVPLQTEDHMLYYRAVKQRFMRAMRDFRPHRMPNPAESTHFGRWSDCAHEVLRRRAQREMSARSDSAPARNESAAPQTVSTQINSVERAVALSGGTVQTAYSGTPAIVLARLDENQTDPLSWSTAPTLLEQAQVLAPAAYDSTVARAPGTTPNLHGSGYTIEQMRGRRTEVSESARVPSENADAILRNLEFSSRASAPDGRSASSSDKTPDKTSGKTPGKPGSREATLPPVVAPAAMDVHASGPGAVNVSVPGDSYHINSDDGVQSDEEVPAECAVDSTFAPPAEPAFAAGKPHPLDSAGFNVYVHDRRDTDVSSTSPAPPETLETAGEVARARVPAADRVARAPAPGQESNNPKALPEAEDSAPIAPPVFSDTLLTGDEEAF